MGDEKCGLTILILHTRGVLGKLHRDGGSEFFWLQCLGVLWGLGEESKIHAIFINLGTLRD